MKTPGTVVALLLLTLPSAPLGSEPAEGAPAHPPPAIPGITAPDAFPNACVDCHLNYEQQKLDVRFATLLAAWQQGATPKLLEKARAAAPGATLTGKHPAVAGAVSDVPRKCLVCHGKTATKAPPFAAMLHAIHLEGGAENHFLSLFGGSCTHCHKLDRKTGRLTVPSRRGAVGAVDAGAWRSRKTLPRRRRRGRATGAPPPSRVP
jgi:hypothetical protein